MNLYINQVFISAKTKNELTITQLSEINVTIENDAGEVGPHNKDCFLREVKEGLYREKK